MESDVAYYCSSRRFFPLIIHGWPGSKFASKQMYCTLIKFAREREEGNGTRINKLKLVVLIAVPTTHDIYNWSAKANILTTVPRAASLRTYITNI
jgi:hypothetical protein